MQTNPFRKRLQMLGHLLAGAVILIPAFEKFQQGETSYWLFLISGLLFISIAIFHAPISRRYTRADALFFAIVAILMGVMAFDYYYEGKSGLLIVLPRWVMGGLPGKRLPGKLSPNLNKEADARLARLHDQDPII